MVIVNNDCYSVFVYSIEYQKYLSITVILCES